jgi:hypothetical protein
MGKFEKITDHNFNDYIKYIIEKYNYADAIDQISNIKYPNTDVRIGKYAGMYYETYKKYTIDVDIHNFDKNAYEKNKNLFNKIY